MGAGIWLAALPSRQDGATAFAIGEWRQKVGIYAPGSETNGTLGLPKSVT